MAEPTLDALARRLAEVERKIAELAVPTPAKGWRQVAGMFRDDDFSRRVDAEALAIREAGRRAADEEAGE